MIVRLLIAQQVPLQAGPLLTLAKPNLLPPMMFSRIGGSANLSIDAASGTISAAGALVGGTGQSITGAVTGATAATAG